MGFNANIMAYGFRDEGRHNFGTENEKIMHAYRGGIYARNSKSVFLHGTMARIPCPYGLYESAKGSVGAWAKGGVPRSVS